MVVLYLVPRLVVVMVQVLQMRMEMHNMGLERLWDDDWLLGVFPRMTVVLLMGPY